MVLCVSGLSAVNAISPQLRDSINLGLTRWRLAVYVDAVTEIGRNSVSKHQIQPECGKLGRLTRDGTVEPVSRDQILRRER